MNKLFWFFCVLMRLKANKRTSLKKLHFIPKKFLS